MSLHARQLSETRPRLSCAMTTFVGKREDSRPMAARVLEEAVHRATQAGNQATTPQGPDAEGCGERAPPIPTRQPVDHWRSHTENTPHALYPIRDPHGRENLKRRGGDRVRHPAPKDDEAPHARSGWSPPPNSAISTTPRRSRKRPARVGIVETRQSYNQSRAPCQKKSRDQVVLIGNPIHYMNAIGPSSGYSSTLPCPISEIFEVSGLEPRSVSCYE